MQIRPIVPAIGVAAVMAAIFVATPASGISTAKLSKQIKQLKAQVAAIQQQQGPAGAPGAPGAPGSARAYGMVAPGSCSGPDPAPCSATAAKGITSVTRTSTGYYCVVAAGIDPSTTTPIVGVDWGSTTGPEGNAAALSGGLGTCDGGFRVTTERLPATAPITATTVNDVSFTILIP